MNDGITASRSELLKKIQAADFYALDMQLYLNTHPNCAKALKKYSDAVNESYELKKEYQRKYGPLTAAASSQLPPWQWIEDPWVWERSI